MFPRPNGPDFDPHPFYGGGGFPGGGLTGPTLALAAMSLFWLAALTWLLWPWIHSRLPVRARTAEPLQQEEKPASVELLRQRYVLGQIDAFTFEEMLDHLLISRAREQEFSAREAVARAAGWDRHATQAANPPRVDWATQDGAAWTEGDPRPHARYH